MKWQGINEFVYVAEAESFTRASKRLNISTAQVSRQVTALEQRLKVKLLYRTTRRVSLTEQGQVFYQHCRAVLDGLEVAEQTITHLQTEPRGKIKLTAPVTYGEQVIMPLVNDFASLYPEIEVTAYLSNRQIDLVDEAFDLAIRLGHLDDSSMIARRLSSRSHYVCASPDYVKHMGPPHSISELDQHNCLVGTLDHWRFLDSGNERKVRITGNIQCNSGTALVDAALKGLGIVQLPDYYVEQHLKSGKLISLLDNLRAPEEGIWAIYPNNRFLSPKVRVLIDYLAKKLN